MCNNMLDYVLGQKKGTLPIMGYYAKFFHSGYKYPARDLEAIQIRAAGEVHTHDCRWLGERQRSILWLQNKYMLINYKNSYKFSKKCSGNVCFPYSYSFHMT